MRRAAIQKEGDTPTFMHLIPNGLGAPQRPDWGGWAGRYRFNEDLNMWWCDVRDAWQGDTHRDNTLVPWVVQIQNDFRARADWCVAKTFGAANHEPVPVLQGNASRDVLLIDAAVGTERTLSAAGSSDPDGDELSYLWRYYAEAGAFDGNVAIDRATQCDCTVHVPKDAKGRTTHVVLQVTDDGVPPLTRYRRAVLTGVR